MHHALVRVFGRRVEGVDLAFVLVGLFMTLAGVAALVAGLTIEGGGKVLLLVFAAILLICGLAMMGVQSRRTRNRPAIDE